MIHFICTELNNFKFHILLNYIRLVDQDLVQLEYFRSGRLELMEPKRRAYFKVRHGTVQCGVCEVWSVWSVSRSLEPPCSRTRGGVTTLSSCRRAGTSSPWAGSRSWSGLRSGYRGLWRYCWSRAGTTSQTHGSSTSSPPCTGTYIFKKLWCSVTFVHIGNVNYEK